ncbi:MAG: RsmD family RNA methyltransferase [Thioalkalivibrionaceae bacterium]
MQVTDCAKNSFASWAVVSTLIQRYAMSERRRAPSRHGGHVRIIGGRWRSRRLTVIDGPGLRPTPDALRETLFNWLAGALDRPILDAFAGTGALGLEAVSRGAPSALLIERDPAACAALRRNVETLWPSPAQNPTSGLAAPRRRSATEPADGSGARSGEAMTGDAGQQRDQCSPIETVCGDALRWRAAPISDALAGIVRQYGPIGGVLLDPPFHQGLVSRWLAGWADAENDGLLAADCWCYIEHEAQGGELLMGPPGFVCMRERRFGETLGTLWRREGA